MSDENPAVLTATAKTKEALGHASPWLMFLAVMGYIGCGVLALAGIGMALVGGLLSHMDEMGGEIGRFTQLLWPALGILYIGFAAVTFFPALLLHRTASRAKKYGKAGVPEDLEGVAVNIRSLARYWGICTIVLLAIYTIAIIGILIAVLAMPHRF